ncbi:aminoglycoside phosphotransferase family protein [Actinoplanes sp. NPDC051513]|uniref:aminoglycoside phosphotransferase family protein n=1 Tax=Actinoplanes sp. NPDC051513 TaxID=3363908 RepID=UPI0037A209E0
MTTEAWPTAARLDAPRVLERIASITGVRLVLEGPAPGGEVGAAYVRWPDGRRSVLTAARTRSAVLVDLARAAGVPTPRHELTARVDGIRVVVQQRLPGTPPGDLDTAVVRQMLAVNDQLAGVLAAEPDPRPAELYLTSDGPGFCLHEPLEAFNVRTARLLGWVRSVGADGSHMVGDDLVHMDFHPGNILVDRGRLSGVVDWDGAVRGDRHFDLVTLLFHLRAHAPALAGDVQDRLGMLSSRRLRAYWAHMSLRQVDWSIRHHDAATVDRWLDVAEAGIASL